MSHHIWVDISPIACILAKSSLTLTLNEWMFDLSFSWVSLLFFKAGELVLNLTMWLLTLYLFKNNLDTQSKLRLNLHSLSVCELLEYRPVP
jgi:hypothetical protein